MCRVLCNALRLLSMCRDDIVPSSRGQPHICEQNRAIRGAFQWIAVKVKDPRVLLKNPGALSKDPGVFLKDTGILYKDPGVL